MFARCPTVGPVFIAAASPGDFRLREISSPYDYFLASLVKSAVASASNHGRAIVCVVRSQVPLRSSPGPLLYGFLAFATFAVFSFLSTKQQAEDVA